MDFRLRARGKMSDTGIEGSRTGIRSSAQGRVAMIDLLHRRGVVLAGTLGAVLVASWPVAAQQPLPPGSPLIGRPDTDDAKKLAPVPAPPLAAAADKLP